MTKLSSIVIFDTNVLLTKPTALLEYKDAEIVIPEVVLSELDKLKVARVDADLRFRGREVSRLMFDLAEGASLIEGVDLPSGGRLRVVPLDISGIPLPDGFTTRSSDDKILATAYLLKNHPNLRGNAVKEDCKIKLVTNDLNLLLKAQTYDVDVEQYGSGDDISFSKRYIVRPFQRYRVPLGILGVSLGVFFAVLLVAWSAGVFARDDVPGNRNGLATLDSEQRALLTTDQETAFSALESLATNPSDAGSVKILADFFFDRVEDARIIGDQAAVIRDGRRGIDYFERYLRMQPDDLEARVDLATLHFRTGNTERAMQVTQEVLDEDPNNVAANLNMGTLYMVGYRDFERARAQIERVIELTQNDINQQFAFNQAQQALAFMEHEEQAIQQGTPTDALPSDGQLGPGDLPLEQVDPEDTL
ncbi:MAG: PIN domain-containing protein [Coriobacteriia bacterium]|nr:PIN domain-containing protein [Coriobacteriia bacterium]MCL2745770.1 PIN domain-containing protein [Coriobacteriia bacterium]MCL2870213.1 PIN domain-containing protein [Coriobacteriia bacterium]